MPEYIAVRPFKYNSRMLAAGDRVVISRTFGRVFCAQRKVKPALVASDISAGRVSPNEARRARGLPPIDATADEMKALRAAYRDKFGKGPGPSWSAATLREKIAAA